MSRRFDRNRQGRRAAAMTSLSSGVILSLPVRLHGIEIGRPTDLILDRESMRLLGLEVRCGDATHRFLPLAAARIGADEIAIASALILLDELPFYRAKGRPLRSLRGAPVETAAGPAGSLRDVIATPEGAIGELVVDGPAGERRLPVDATVRIEERRAPAA
jgi:hypothetical protein